MDIRLKIEFLTAKSIKGGRGCIRLGKEESLFPPGKRKEFRVKGTEGFPGPENRDCRFRGRRDFRFRKRRDFRFRKRRDLELLLVIQLGIRGACRPNTHAVFYLLAITHAGLLYWQFHYLRSLVDLRRVRGSGVCCGCSVGVEPTAIGVEGRRLNTKSSVTSGKGVPHRGRGKVAGSGRSNLLVKGPGRDGPER